MTKKELIKALKDVDDNAEVRVADEGDILEHEIINVQVEDGDAVLEFREN